MSDTERLAQIIARLDNGTYQGHEASVDAHWDVQFLVRMYAQKEMTSEIMYETLDRAQAEGTKLTLENRELRDRLTAVYNQVAELVKDQFFRRRELETRVAELEEIIKRAPLQQWSAGAPTH